MKHKLRIILFVTALLLLIIFISLKLSHMLETKEKLDSFKKLEVSSFEEISLETTLVALKEVYQLDKKELEELLGGRVKLSDAQLTLGEYAHKHEINQSKLLMRVKFFVEEKSNK